MSNGFNTDVEHRGRVYHVQTENAKRRGQAVETLIFEQGRILVRMTASWQEVAAASDLDITYLPDAEVQLDPERMSARGEVLRPLDEGALRRLFEGCDAVVNLVGILNERGRSGDGFRRAHTELTGKAVRAAREAGARKFEIGRAHV